LVRERSRVQSSPTAPEKLLSEPISEDQLFSVIFIIFENFRGTSGTSGTKLTQNDTVTAIVDEPAQTLAAAVYNALAALPVGFPEELAASIGGGLRGRARLLVRATTK
jgi:hypothetical protein